MMRSFGARADCAVTDEPFYAAYLVATGLIHPMREEVIASQPTDWREVADALIGPPPEGKPRLVPEAHDASHAAANSAATGATGSSTPSSSARPRRCLPPIRQKRDDFTLDEIGLPAQAELFDRAAERLGRAPPVIESQDVLADPRGRALRALRGLRRSVRPGDAVLGAGPTGDATASGRRSWYQAVERSTRIRRAAAAKSASTNCPTR